jgi:hypothetical protein
MIVMGNGKRYKNGNLKKKKKGISKQNLLDYGNSLFEENEERGTELAYEKLDKLKSNKKISINPL